MPALGRVHRPLCLTLAAAVVFTGCGSSGGGHEVTPAQVTRAKRSVEKEATRLVNNVPDRYLKGPKKVRAKCKADGATRIKCNATGYARPQAIYDSPTAPYSVGIADEDWVVPVRGDELGKPRIGEGGYAIGNFLEADNANGCTAGKSLNC